MTDWKKLEDELLGDMRREMAALMKRVQVLEELLKGAKEG